MDIKYRTTYIVSTQMVKHLQIFRVGITSSFTGEWRLQVIKHIKGKKKSLGDFWSCSYNLGRPIGFLKLLNPYIMLHIVFRTTCFPPEARNSIWKWDKFRSSYSKVKSEFLPLKNDKSFFYNLCEDGNIHIYSDNPIKLTYIRNLFLSILNIDSD